MDRYAIFIDAGYLFAAGGQLVHSTKKRENLHLDFRAFLEALPARLKLHPGIEHLRTYWYDAATDGIPTPTHQAVARLTGVKLRLGRLTGGQQKGVDSYVVRDLMRLGLEHAIASAYLLTGDEDIRQGMIEAQESGVKVTLIGIEPCEANQSEMLLREADDLVRLDAAFLDQFLALRATEAASPLGERDSGFPEGAGGRGAVSATELGRREGDSWKERAAPPELAALRALKQGNRRQGVPPEIDRELLAAARAMFGTNVADAVRKQMRDGFWQAIMHQE